MIAKIQQSTKLEWKATSGKLTVAKDEKSATWRTEENKEQDYTVTVTIEVTLPSGKKETFDKSVVISSIEPSDSDGGSGGDSSNAVKPTEELELQITGPTKEMTYTAEKENVEITGTVGSKYKIEHLTYAVFVNGNEESSLKGEISIKGNWKTPKIKLEQGLNTIVVAAVDGEGRESTVHLKVSYLDDIDNDGLSFAIEKELGTDPSLYDTDGDGLNDLYEYMNTHTDPLVADSDNNGVADGQEDSDSDGLTNAQEFAAKTNPLEADTDNDGLNDGDEIKRGTDPLNPDTDGDELLDGSEIKLGFDPLKSDTDGNEIIDSKETTVQALDESLLSEVVTDENPLIPSVTITGEGDIGETVTVSDASLNPVMETIPGLVGKPIDIQNRASFEEATLSFTLKDELLNERELSDYVVFWFDEDKNMVVPLPTDYDEETKTISAKTDHFSKFGVIDVINFIRGTEGENPSVVIEKGKADIVFVIDSTGSMGGAINNVKNNINNFVNKLEEEKVDVRLGLVEYKDIVADGPNSTKNLGWTESPDEFKKKINSISVTGGGDRPESAVDALEEARIMGFKNNHAKFMILVTDADYHENTRFEDLTSMEQEINRLVKDEIVASVITSNHYGDSTYGELINQTGGVSANIYGNFATELEKLIEKIGTVTHEKVTIRLSTGELVRLDKIPDKADKETDTDGDGIPDSEELKEKQKACFNTMGGALDAIMGDIECWTYHSNPAEKDTDFDGYEDDVDAQPTKPYAPDIVLLHGWTSNSNATFGARSDATKMNHTKSKSSEKDLFTNIDKQKVNKMKSESFSQSLSSTLGSTSANVYAFNYPNLADPKLGAEFLNGYLNNLAKEGKIKGPKKKGEPDNQPKVVLGAHSMGGLVARYYNEKIDNDKKDVEVDGIITIATPHWGASAIASWAAEDPLAPELAEAMNLKEKKDVDSPAVKALDPTPAEYEVDRWSGGIRQTHVPSWTEKLNKDFTKNGAKYFAVGGVYIVDTPDGDPPIELQYQDTTTGKNTNYGDNAKTMIKANNPVEYFSSWKPWKWFEGKVYDGPLIYDDIIVPLNSALGSSLSVGRNCPSCHEEGKVLNFNDRYVVVGKKSSAEHNKITWNEDVYYNVKYWITKQILTRIWHL